MPSQSQNHLNQPNPPKPSHQKHTISPQETDQIKRINNHKEDELSTCHALEWKRLPKILKADGKTRALMYRESIRISICNITLDQEKEKVKQVWGEEGVHEWWVMLRGLFGEKGVKDGVFWGRRGWNIVVIVLLLRIGFTKRIE